MITVRCAFDTGATPPLNLRFEQVPRVGDAVAFPNYGKWVPVYGQWRIHSVLWTPAKGDKHMECAANLVCISSATATTVSEGKPDA